MAIDRETTPEQSDLDRLCWIDIPAKGLDSSAVAYVSGACLYSDGPGGWAVVIAFPDGTTIERKGGDARTTSNRMQLRAAIEAMRATGDAAEVVVVTHSQYVQLGITERIRMWKRNGWIASNEKPVKNPDLWLELDAIKDDRVTWEWIRRGTGSPHIERASYLAREAAEEACSRLPPPAG
jgi:ribonuclease HI